MKKQPLNYSIQFDGNSATIEEQRDAFLSLLKCLMSLSVNNHIKNTKFLSQKEKLEHQIYINNYHQKYYEILLKNITKTDSKTDKERIWNCIRDSNSVYADQNWFWDNFKKFENISQTQINSLKYNKRENFKQFSLLWWALEDSNFWHPPCKGGALPTELNALSRINHN